MIFHVKSKLLFKIILWFYYISLFPPSAANWMVHIGMGYLYHTMSSYYILVIQLGLDARKTEKKGLPGKAESPEQ